MPEKETAVVVMPVVGFSDWGLGLPLDLEETLSMSVLAESSKQLASTIRHLVLPPMRFVIGLSESSFFTLDPESVQEALREIIVSMKESGYRKVVFYNSSPWNEELLNVAGRDLRIELGMQMFCINLAGIGLDLMPGRSSTREDCQVLGSNSPVDEAKFVLEKSTGKLVGLLEEVAARPPLANRGKIPKKEGDEG